MWIERRPYQTRKRHLVHSMRRLHRTVCGAEGGRDGGQRQRRAWMYDERKANKKRKKRSIESDAHY